MTKGSLKTTRYIGSRCKISNNLSQGVLISQILFLIFLANSAVNLLDFLCQEYVPLVELNTKKLLIDLIRCSQQLGEETLILFWLELVIRK